MVTWDEIFGPVDKVVADMPTVERACSTCGFADVPPMPEDTGKGWLAKCEAPVPVNVMLAPTAMKMEFSAADAARWDSKRQRPCPCWKPKDVPL